MVNSQFLFRYHDDIATDETLKYIQVQVLSGKHSAPKRIGKERVHSSNWRGFGDVKRRDQAFNEPRLR